MTHMERVGVRALQQNAAAVVARAAAGEIVEITDRGRPVAQLTPLPTGTLNGLIAAGLARAGRRELSTEPPLRAHRSRRSLGELLSAARRDER